MTALQDDPPLPDLTVGVPPHEVAWDERTALRAVLREHPVVLLRTPGLSPEAHIRFAEQIGTVVSPRRDEFQHPDNRRIVLFGNVTDADGRQMAGSAIDFGWHSDESFRAHPNELSFLYGDAVPPSGGDTHFANLYRVHDDLDAATRGAWSVLDVVHTARSRYFDGWPDRESVHPLIRRHPESGRPLVFASPAYTTQVVGLDAAASDALLAHVADALDPPDVVHRWQPGDLLVWDNRAVVHRATDFDHNELRRLWRISVRLR